MFLSTTISNCVRYKAKDRKIKTPYFWRVVWYDYWHGCWVNFQWYIFLVIHLLRLRMFLILFSGNCWSLFGFKLCHQWKVHPQIFWTVYMRPVRCDSFKYCLSSLWILRPLLWYSEINISTINTEIFCISR